MKFFSHLRYLLDCSFKTLAEVLESLNNEAHSTTSCFEIVVLPFALLVIEDGVNN